MSLRKTFLGYKDEKGSASLQKDLYTFQGECIYSKFSKVDDLSKRKGRSSLPLFLTGRNKPLISNVICLFSEDAAFGRHDRSPVWRPAREDHGVVAKPGFLRADLVWAAYFTVTVWAEIALNEASALGGWVFVRCGKCFQVCPTCCSDPCWVGTV